MPTVNARLPHEGQLLQCLFNKRLYIDCTKETDGFYTMDGHLITDQSGNPMIPDEWLPVLLPDSHNRQLS
jgi:hypothetical protein